MRLFQQPARDKFIWCRNCNAIHHVSPFDKAPTYSLLENKPHAISADDWRSFMDAHAGHRLEPLEAIAKKCFTSGSLFDPMSVGYLEVFNGQQRLLLRRTRKSIDESLRFELVSGRLVYRGVSLEVQAHEIKQEMKRHFAWRSGLSFDDCKIERFIELFRGLIQELDPEEIKVGGYSQSDDLLSYGMLQAGAVEKLIARCAAHFSPEELADLRRFIETHLDACDVMAPLMRLKVEVEQPAEL
jgi:hypothetical protein